MEGSRMYGSGSLYEFLIVGGMLAVTPGPNMVYVMSRSIAQGRAAGLISLAGVMVGYFFYMFGAAFGITALFLKVPYAGSALAGAGVAYLLYLAWQALKPGGRSPFEIRELPGEPPLRLLIGTDAVLLAKAASAGRSKEDAAWEALSNSTDFDGEPPFGDTDNGKALQAAMR